MKGQKLPHASLKAHRGRVEACCITKASCSHGKGERFATTCGEEGFVKVFDLQNSICIRSVKAHEGAIGSVQFMVDCHVLTVSKVGKMKVWDLALIDDIKEDEEVDRADPTPSSVHRVLARQSFAKSSKSSIRKTKDDGSGSKKELLLQGNSCVVVNCAEETIHVLGRNGSHEISAFTGKFHAASFSLLLTSPSPSPLQAPLNVFTWRVG